MLLPFSFLSLLLPLRAADEKAPPARVPDFSAIKTPDEFWKQMEKLQDPPEEKPASEAEAMAQVKTWFTTQRAAAEAFIKTFPADPRSWQARMMALRAERQLHRLNNEPGDPAAERKKLEEIVNAPDAPAPIKGEAAFMSAATLTADLDPDKPQTFAAFYQAVDAALAKYPDHPLVGQLKTLEMQVLGDDFSPSGEALLTKLASGSDPRLAEAAKGMIEHRRVMMELKTKPLDLKFTALDGRPADAASLRGKVVLVDFWASWCGPCMGEMPNVVSTYEKLHEKGFEILGISLDQDKEAMKGALQKQNMTWAQYFDGGGWDNKISKSFGIQSIPAAWLIDKKGMLRRTDLRGEALAAAVEKLLAE